MIHFTTRLSAIIYCADCTQSSRKLADVPLGTGTPDLTGTEGAELTIGAPSPVMSSLRLDLSYFGLRGLTMHIYMWEKRGGGGRGGDALMIMNAIFTRRVSYIRHIRDETPCRASPDSRCTFVEDGTSCM